MLNLHFLRYLKLSYRKIKKETKIKIKNQAKPQLAQVHNALKRAQGATTKYARRQQVPQTNSSRQKRPTELISLAAPDHQSKLTQRGRSSTITSCNKMLQIFIHRVVHSVINPIEQTQDTNLLSVLQTTKLTLTQHFRTANNTIHHIQ